MRWKLIATGMLFAVMWLMCQAITIAPAPGDLSSEYTRWAVGNALAMLAGFAFGAAAFCRADRR